MNCEEIRERVPDVAAGLAQTTAEEKQHFLSCSSCAEELESFRRTMALLDEWQAPEPSPYFDTRLRARLREEMAEPQAGETGWLMWFRRPVLAAALTVVMAVGVGLFFVRGGHSPDDRVASVEMSQPGTAVSDLQSLEANHDMYSDFDLLDDADTQQQDTANP